MSLCSILCILRMIIGITCEYTLLKVNLYTSLEKTPVES